MTTTTDSPKLKCLFSAKLKCLVFTYFNSLLLINVPTNFTVVSSTSSTLLLLLRFFCGLFLALYVISYFIYKVMTMTKILGLFLFLVTGASNAGILYSIQESNDHLISIDTDTLTFTDIGALGVTFNFGGLAYDSNSDTLYMIGGRGNQSLYTVDRNTGSASLIGSHGITDLFGLAYDTKNDVLYAGTRFNGNNLYSLDAGTGLSSLIGSSGSATLDGLAYNANTDTLIDLAAGNGDIYSIDRSTALSTLLFNGDFVNNNGFAYDYDSDLYWAIDWSGNLFTYDPNAGYSRTTLLSGLGSHDGLAYVGTTTIPEPSSLAIFGLGALGFGAWRRRQSKA